MKLIYYLHEMESSLIEFECDSAIGVPSELNIRKESLSR